MTVKALELPVMAMESTQYQTGWYRDTTTGEWFYYDAPSDEWYVSVAGLLYPAGEDWKSSADTAAKFPNAPLDVAYGESVRFTCTFLYVGPDWDGYLEGAFGDNSWPFGEALATVVKDPKHISKTLTTKPFTWYMTLPVVGGWGNLGSGEQAVRIKLRNGAGGTQSGKNCSYVWPSIINVVTAAEFTGFAITSFSKVS